MGEEGVTNLSGAKFRTQDSLLVIKDDCDFSRVNAFNIYWSSEDSIARRIAVIRVSVGVAQECDLQVQVPILALRKGCWTRECRLLTLSIKQSQVFALGKCRCEFMCLGLSGPSWNCIPYEIIGYCPASASLRHAIHVGSGTWSWNHCAGFSNSFFGNFYGFFYRAMWVTWGKASMLLQKTYVKSK